LVIVHQYSLDYGRLMPEADRFVDDDPDYANDAEADREAEIVGLEPDDPRTVPPDQGDSGNADPPGGGA
jgi:hypothetical protein